MSNADADTAGLSRGAPPPTPLVRCRYCDTQIPTVPPPLCEVCEQPFHRRECGEGGYRCIPCFEAAVLLWQPFRECPCGCGVQSAKLTKRNHALHCGSKAHGARRACRSCVSRRNVRKGKRGQRIMHAGAGGQGTAPTNEEWTSGYDLTVVTLKVQAEAKAGNQVPKVLAKLVGSEFMRHAFRQAEMATKIGSGAVPGVFLSPEGDSGGWLIVRLERSP